MPQPETLRVRLQLMSRFEQLAERLEHGDTTAIRAAQDHLYGVALCGDTYTLGLVFRALTQVLSDMQQEIDAGGWKYSLAGES